MKNYYHEMPDGYRETIERGLCTVRQNAMSISRGKGMRRERMQRLKEALETADAVVIGAVTMNLRADDSFAENEGWHQTSAAYSDFIRRHEKLRLFYLELDVGSDTPMLAAPCTKDTKKHRKTANLNYLPHNPARMSFRRCA